MKAQTLEQTCIDVSDENLMLNRPSKIPNKERIVLPAIFNAFQTAYLVILSGLYAISIIGLPIMTILDAHMVSPYIQ